MEKKQEILQQNEEMKVQNEVLEHRNNLIMRKNEYITASIRYAKTMQQSMLPDINSIKKHFDIFILYKPKDIVSGDFYWFFNKVINNVEHQFIACVDCTGHGVPGAFMALLSATLLNEILKVKKVYDPKEILSELNAGIVQELRQDSSENNDGMEMALCKMRKTETSCNIVYAGAGLPIFVHRMQEKTLERVKACRKKIGGLRTSALKEEFNNQEFELNKGDMIYLASDGWVDQNDISRKRLGTAQFMSIIESVAHSNLKEQEQAFVNTLEKFQGLEQQRDDITIIGIRI